jgi:outer membrane protein TolC
MKSCRRDSHLPLTVTSLLRVFFAAAWSGLTGGCAGYQAKDLPLQPFLVASVSALDRARPSGGEIPADKPLTPAEVGVLAVQNNPDLKAIRAQRGIARAQIIEAGLLPDPVVAASYGVLLAGPDFANSFSASLTADIAALVTLSARREAASRGAQQVDANIVWQEWQTDRQAQTLTINLVEQKKLLLNLGRTLDLLQERAAITTTGVAQGNATLQMLAPDIVAVTSLQTQHDALVLAQEQRWQSLDTLLGLEPKVRLQLDTEFNVPTLSEDDVLAMLKSLPDRRPDLIALRLGYASQEAKLRAAVLGQFPALTLGPSYGNDTARVQTLGPAITISLPIFNRNRGVIAIQQATREHLYAEYEARLATAQGGVEALLANVALLGKQLQVARVGIGQSRSLAANAESALRGGLLDELSYVQLVLSRLEKERQVIGLEQQFLDEQTALATLLGARLPPIRLAMPKRADLL